MKIMKTVKRWHAMKRKEKYMGREKRERGKRGSKRVHFFIDESKENS